MESKGKNDQGFPRGRQIITQSLVQLIFLGLMCRWSNNKLQWTQLKVPNTHWGVGECMCWIPALALTNTVNLKVNICQWFLARRGIAPPPARTSIKKQIQVLFVVAVTGRDAAGIWSARIRGTECPPVHTTAPQMKKWCHVSPLPPSSHQMPAVFLLRTMWILISLSQSK